MMRKLSKLVIARRPNGPTKQSRATCEILDCFGFARLSLAMTMSFAVGTENAEEFL
jgi:hypothetical protein